MNGLQESMHANIGSEGAEICNVDSLEEVVTMIKLIIEGIKSGNKWQEYGGSFNQSSMKRLLKQQLNHLKRAYTLLEESDNLQLSDKVVKSLNELASGLSKLREFLRPFIPLMPSENALLKRRDQSVTEVHPSDEGRRIYSSLGSLTPQGKGITVYSNDIPEEEFTIIDKLANGFFLFHISPTWKVSSEDQTISVSRNGIEIAIKIGKVEKPVKDQSQQFSPTKAKTLREDLKLLNQDLTKDLENLTLRLNFVTI